MSNGGAKHWYFPDGFLPEKMEDNGSLESHEALMVLNVHSKKASIVMDIFFEESTKNQKLEFCVEPKTVKTLRLDSSQDLQGVSIPVLTQYALRLVSDVEVVVQFGRLDATQKNLAYYGSMGFCE